MGRFIESGPNQHSKFRARGLHFRLSTALWQTAKALLRRLPPTWPPLLQKHNHLKPLGFLRPDSHKPHIVRLAPNYFCFEGKGGYRIIVLDISAGAPKTRRP